MLLGQVVLLIALSIETEVDAGNTNSPKEKGTGQETRSPCKDSHHWLTELIKLNSQLMP